MFVLNDTRYGDMLYMRLDRAPSHLFKKAYDFITFWLMGRAFYGFLKCLKRED